MKAGPGRHPGAGIFALWPETLPGPVANQAALVFESDDEAVNKIVQLGYKDSAGKTVEIEAVVTGVQENTSMQGNAMNANLALLEQAHDRATTGLPDATRPANPNQGLRPLCHISLPKRWA